MTIIDFDVILEKIGAFGIYQTLAIFLYGHASLLQGMYNISPVFVNFVPSFRCSVPSIDISSIHNLTEKEILNLTTPYKKDKGEYNTCERYGYNLSSCSISLEECVNKSAPAIPCDQDYHYDRTNFAETLVTELNLVCDDAYLNYLTSTMFFVGGAIGSAVFGFLADKIGRKPVLLMSSLTALISLVGTAFVWDVWQFNACRVIFAFAARGMYLTSFVSLCEATNEKWFGFFGMFFHLMFPVGYMILSGLAYHWNAWRKLTIVIAVFTSPYVIFALFLPESPRWLFAAGKDKKAKKISRQLAKFNRVILVEPEIWEEATIPEPNATDHMGGDVTQPSSIRTVATSFSTRTEVDEDRTYSTADLFRTTNMRRVTLKIILNWVSSSVVYYGLTLTVGSLYGNVFVNNTLAGTVEIVGYVVTLLLLKQFGERLSLTILFAVGGLSLLSNVITTKFAGNNQGLLTASVVFSMVGKSATAGVYGALYNVTAKLFPTVVRGNAVAVGTIAANIGSIFATLVLQLQTSVSWLPGAILSAFSICAMIATYWLPDTRNQPILETIEEAELFYSGHRSSDGH